MNLFSTEWIIAMVSMVIIFGAILDRGSSIMHNSSDGCLGAIAKTLTLIICLALGAIVAMATLFIIIGPPSG